MAKYEQDNSKNSGLNTLFSNKWFIRGRDALLLLIVIGAVVAWQTRGMLTTNGTVNIPQQNIVSLSGEVLPLLTYDKPNLIYFFAPWCTVCSLSIGNLAYLDQEKVNIVVIALDYSSIEEVRRFVEEHEVQNTVLLGQNELKEQFAIPGYPSYYLLDENHDVVSRSFGYSTAVGLKLREVFGQ